jgi:hypothetical protein
MEYLDLLFLQPLFEEVDKIIEKEAENAIPLVSKFKM